MTLVDSSDQVTPRKFNRFAKPLIGILCLASVGIAANQIGGSDVFSGMSRPENMTLMFQSIGPIAVVIFLLLAVVISPIPSGPIAMAAGAIYGTWEGGALTAIGAVAGAIIAFCLSRWLGYRPLSRSNLKAANWITRARSQEQLALLVLVSRLVPFISFDAVSYAAGLTVLSLRNFVIATTIGVLPASFVFAALGAGMAAGSNMFILTVASSVTVIVPVGWLLFRRFRKTI